MKQSCHFLLLAALCLFGAASLPAKTQVQGRIVDAQGEPLAPANILLLTAADSAFVKGEIAKTAISAKPSRIASTASGQAMPGNMWINKGDFKK